MKSHYVSSLLIRCLPGSGLFSSTGFKGLRLLTCVIHQSLEPASFTRLDFHLFMDLWTYLAHRFQELFLFTSTFVHGSTDSSRSLVKVLLQTARRRRKRKTTNTILFPLNGNYSDKDVASIYFAYRKVIVFQWNLFCLRLLIFIFPSFCNYA